jgi:hypothetical protein
MKDPEDSAVGCKDCFIMAALPFPTKQTFDLMVKLSVITLFALYKN